MWCVPSKVTPPVAASSYRPIANLIVNVPVRTQVSSVRKEGLRTANRTSRTAATKTSQGDAMTTASSRSLERRGSGVVAIHQTNVDAASPHAVRIGTRAAPPSTGLPGLLCSSSATMATSSRINVGSTLWNGS